VSSNPHIFRKEENTEIIKIKTYDFKNIDEILKGGAE